MPTAKRLPSGNYRVRVYAGRDPSGKPRYESFTAPTKKEAEYQAAQWRLRRSARPSSLTVGAALQRYVDVSAPVLSPFTVTKYRSMIKNHYGPLRALPLDRLRSDQVQAYISELSLTLSPKSVSCVYGLLTAALAQFAPDLRLRVRLPRRVPHELVIPTTEEVRRMIDAADEVFRPVLVIAATMGPRRSEIAALTWSDVRGSSLRISKAYAKSPDGSLVLKPPKTDAGVRTLEIPAVALPYLTPPPDAFPADRIFPLTPDAITRRFERLMAALHLPYRFHSLRHYYDSVLASLGAPDKYIMARMGHATPSMTKQVYQHLLPDRDQALTSAIDAYFSQKT